MHQSIIYYFLWHFIIIFLSMVSFYFAHTRYYIYLTIDHTFVHAGNISFLQSETKLHLINTLRYYDACHFCVRLEYNSIGRIA